MNTKSNPTTAGANSRRSGAPMPGHAPQEDQSPAATPGRSGSGLGEHPKGEHPKGEHPKGEHPKGEHTKRDRATGERPKGEHTTGVPEDAVARRTPTGWKVGDEEVPDLTSAMVLADLLAAELPSEEQWPIPGGMPSIPDTMPDQVVASERGPEAEGSAAPGAGTRGTRPRNPDALRAASVSPGKQATGKRRVSQHALGQQGPGTPGAEIPAADTEQLKETVAQLERALTVRVRVEQAIGVLAERHRLRPRQAFELLRSASRARGARVSQTAGEVVASTTNPLLRIPEELARQPEEPRGRPPRRTRRNP
jgi:ANTAR domain